MINIQARKQKLFLFKKFFLMKVKQRKMSIAKTSNLV